MELEAQYHAEFLEVGPEHEQEHEIAEHEQLPLLID